MTRRRLAAVVAVAAVVAAAGAAAVWAVGGRGDPAAPPGADETAARGADADRRADARPDTPPAADPSARDSAGSEPGEPGAAVPDPPPGEPAAPDPAPADPAPADPAPPVEESPAPRARPAPAPDEEVAGDRASPEADESAPAPSAEGLPVGAARVRDPAGDVADPDGNPPERAVAEADLRAVRLASDGRRLEVTFELDGPVGPSDHWLLWSLELVVAGERAYTVSVQPAGDGLVGGVFDWRTQVQQPLPSDDVAADGSAVRLRLPAGALPRIDGPFEWSATTELDGAYSDRVPAGDAQDAPTAAFPQ